MLNIKNENEEIYREYSYNSQIVELETKIQSKSNCKSLIKELADNHYKEGNYHRALSCYLKLLSFEPQNARVWNKLAVVFLRLEDYKTAMELSRIAHRLINKEMGK
ncbi:MAG: tetratricopeptide repeat protein [Candidatus Heimdallarchaeota archaeon]